MKKEISITSTSFLIPNHFAWAKLKNYNLNFNYVGNLTSGFYKANKKNILFSYIFINDLINDNEEKNINKKKINKISNSILNLAKFRAKKTHIP